MIGVRKGNRNQESPHGVARRPAARPPLNFGAKFGLVRCHVTTPPEGPSSSCDGGGGLPCQRNSSDSSPCDGGEGLPRPRNSSRTRMRRAGHEEWRGPGPSRRLGAGLLLLTEPSWARAKLCLSLQYHSATSF